MGISTFHSTNPDVKTAVQELKTHCPTASPEIIIFFASSIYDPITLAAEMGSAFPNSQSFGCTTAGELISGHMLNNSIVAMAFEGELAQWNIQVVEDISSNSALSAAFNNFEHHFDQSVSAMDVEKYVGIVLMDGISKAEENVMDNIGDLSSILFVGGSAGDDMHFKETFVFANGKAYSHAAVSAILKPVHGFGFIKTQSFERLDKELTATRVLEEERTVIEFNNKPAVIAYSEALGKSPEKIGDYFMAHPLGLMVGDEPYVRSPQQTENGKMVFYCSILEGMTLSLLQSSDIIKDTRKVLQQKEAQLEKIRGIINFNCILRTLELQNKNQTGEYGKLFEKYPTIGFSTYGEAYISHINQTATMLVFK